MIVISYIFSVLYLFGYCYFFSISLRELPLTILDITQNLIVIGPYIFIVYLIYFFIYYSFFYVDILIASLDHDLTLLEQKLSTIDAVELKRESSRLLQVVKKLEGYKNLKKIKKRLNFVRKRVIKIERKLKELESSHNEVNLKALGVNQKVKYVKIMMWFLLIVNILAILIFFYYLFCPFHYWWEFYVAIFSYMTIFTINYLKFVEGTSLIAQIIFGIVFSYIFFISAGYIDAKRNLFNNNNHIVIETQTNQYFGNGILWLNQGIVLSDGGKIQFVPWSGITKIVYN